MKKRFLILAVIFTALMLFSCPADNETDPPDPNTPPGNVTEPFPNKNPDAYKNIGVYVWDRNPSGNEYFAKWAGLDVKYAEDFSPREGGWNAIVNDGYGRASSWKNWKAEKPGRRLVLSVPPFPDSEAGSGADRGRQAYQKAADGEFNEYYKQFGEMLKSNGLEDTIIRFGHEMNGDWYSYSIVTGSLAAMLEKQENYKLAFQQFAETLRAIPGTAFEFCWNPNCASDRTPLENSYPGNDYVDYIGFDQYDHSLSTYRTATPDYHELTNQTSRRSVQVRAWTEMVGRRAGMTWFAQFAKERNKPLVIPEWGLWYGGNDDGGDNPYFIEKMYEYINNNNVAWHVYFMFGDVSHSLYATQTYPRAIEKFLELWHPDVSTRVGPTIPPSDSRLGAYNPDTVKEAVKADRTYGGNSWLVGDPWAYSDYAFTDTARGTKGNLVEMWVSGEYNPYSAIVFNNCPESNGFALVYQYPSRDNTPINISLYINDMNTRVRSVGLLPGSYGWGDSYRIYEFNDAIPAGASIRFRPDQSDVQNNPATGLKFDYIIFK